MWPERHVRANDRVINRSLLWRPAMLHNFHVAQPIYKLQHDFLYMTDENYKRSVKGRAAYGGANLVDSAN